MATKYWIKKKTLEDPFPWDLWGQRDDGKPYLYCDYSQYSHAKRDLVNLRRYEDPLPVASPWREVPSFTSAATGLSDYTFTTTATTTAAVYRPVNNSWCGIPDCGLCNPVTDE